jgi:hypothetical protein
MIDDDRDLRVRRYRFVRVPGAMLADRIPPLSLAPPDLVQSDVGPWPSIGDDPVKVTCAGCGHCGTRDGIAREALCWSCWARTWTRSVTTMTNIMTTMTNIVDAAMVVLDPKRVMSERPRPRLRLVQRRRG